MLPTMRLACAALLLLTQTAAAANAPTLDDFCSNIRQSLSSDLEDRAATAYCASHLGLSVHTSTAKRRKTITKTTTKFITATSTSTSTGQTVTTSSEDIVFPSRTATRTIYTSTSTIYSPLTGCPSPTSSAQKRLEQGQAPSAFSALSPSDESEACNCLSVKAATRTVAASTVTKHVTVTRTRTTEKVVHPTTTTISTLSIVLTRTTTTDAYTTTVTVTAFSPFKLLDATSNQWAGLQFDDQTSYVRFDQGESTAAEWGLTESGLLVYDNYYYATGSSFSSGAYVEIYEPRQIQPLQCSISRNASGYCGLGCTFSDDGPYNSLGNGGDWYISEVEGFTLYAVGMTT